MAMAASVAQDPLIVDRLGVRLGGFQLDNISFHVEPAKVTALLGHNGAGKTTLCRLIMGIVRKDSGNVSLGGFDHWRHEKEFKQRVGFLQEESYFYKGMTVGEFVAFVSRFYHHWNRELSEHLLRTFNLPGNKKLGHLSKGMRLKVNLVVTLSHEPSVLLLDEPTSGLDPRARLESLRLLHSIGHEEARAVLFSTHHLHEVEQIADRVILLDRGRVRADESLASLRRVAGPSWSLEQYYLERVQ
jgi:ABC-2 type transport system ATP-binding protein